MKRTLSIIILFLSISVALSANEPADSASTKKKKESSVQLHGSFQTDILVPQEDKAIGATADDPFLSNSYLNLNLTSNYVNAGARLELMHKPLPGFEDGFAGAGIKGLYVSGGYKYFNITIGDIYDQFGSGMLFRAYEDRNLGVDNAIRGARLILTPYKGITFKALGGMQRQYFNFGKDNDWGFDYSKNGMMGFNLDLDIDQWSQFMIDNDYHLRLGGSFVSKYNEDEDIVIMDNTGAYRLNLPKFVGAGEIRADFSHSGWRAMLEYAYKSNDPTAENEYSYRPGQAVFASLGYSRLGMSILAQIKRSENMTFRSDRRFGATAGNLNNMPAFGFTHTYACASNLPYATQANGEWAYQLELAYKFKAKTAMGGKYGTTFKIRGTYVRGLDSTAVDKVHGTLRGTDGFKTTFFGQGEEYYLDAHLEFNKRITKQFSMIAMYMYQRYNQNVIRGHGEFLQAHTIITDFNIKCSKNVNLRIEGQFQYTNQSKEDYELGGHDYGSNVFSLIEVSLFKNFMLSGSEHYYFRSDISYYNVTFAYTHGAHRVQLAYLRAKEGYNCNGGVCRQIPAQKGLTVGYFVQF